MQASWLQPNSNKRVESSRVQSCRVVSDEIQSHAVAMLSIREITSLVFSFNPPGSECGVNVPPQWPDT